MSGYEIKNKGFVNTGCPAQINNEHLADIAHDTSKRWLTHSSIIQGNGRSGTAYSRQGYEHSTTVFLSFPIPIYPNNDKFEAREHIESKQKGKA